MESVFLVLLVLSLSVVWPQPGYIHPDEFFQSTEVIAGKSVSLCLSRPPPPTLPVSLSSLLEGDVFGDSKFPRLESSAVLREAHRWGRGVGVFIGNEMAVKLK